MAQSTNLIAFGPFEVSVLNDILVDTHRAMVEDLKRSQLDLATENFEKICQKCGKNVDFKFGDATKLASRLDDLRTLLPAERANGVVNIMKELNLEEAHSETLSSLVTNLLCLLRLALDSGSKFSVL